MNKKLLTYLLGATFFLASSNSALAISGLEVMQKVSKQSEKHKTQESNVYMKILDAKNRKRDRYFNYTKKIVSSSETRSLVKFYKPTNIKNTALLSHAKKQKDTLQWLYLPAFKTIKKLSIEEKNKSFMGSDFSVADIAGRLVSNDRHRLVKEDKKYYYVESIPKNSQDSYSKLSLVINKKIFVPVKIDFYNKRKKLYKTLSNRKIQKLKGMYVVVDALMKNLETKGQTIITTSEIKVGIPVSDSKVGLRGLKR